MLKKLKGLVSGEKMKSGSAYTEIRESVKTEHSTIEAFSRKMEEVRDCIKYLESRVAPQEALIISFQNQKGGTGKTTLALHFAYFMACNPFAQKKVIVIDADPQGSCRDWAAARKTECPFTVVGYDRPTIHKDIKAITRGYHYAIIDAPPRVTDIARSAVLASHAVIIPVQPSGFDAWASQETFRLVEEAKQYKENLKYALVINRKIVNTAISTTVEKELSRAGLTVFEDAICQRVVFAESVTQGLTVFETCDRYHPAIRECTQFSLDVLSWLKQVDLVSIPIDGSQIDERELYPVRGYG
jgi:chromosome partitioning protein